VDESHKLNDEIAGSFWGLFHFDPGLNMDHPERDIAHF
jgi:hypothetical protein